MYLLTVYSRKQLHQSQIWRWVLSVIRFYDEFSLGVIFFSSTWTLILLNLEPGKLMSRRIDNFLPGPKISTSWSRRTRCQMNSLFVHHSIKGWLFYQPVSSSSWSLRCQRIFSLLMIPPCLRWTAIKTPIDLSLPWNRFNKAKLSFGFTDNITVTFLKLSLM